MSAPYKQKVQVVLRPNLRGDWEAKINRGRSCISTTNKLIATEELDTEIWELVINEASTTCNEGWYPIYFSEIAGRVPFRIRCILTKFL